MVMGRNVLCDSCGGGFEQVAACGCTQNLNESMFLCKHIDFRISKMFSNIEVPKNSSSKSHLQFLVKTNAADIFKNSKSFRSSKIFSKVSKNSNT